MKCREAIPLMHAYLDRDIDEAGHQMLKQHIKSCPACAEHFRHLEKTSAFMHNVDPVKAPSNFTANVLANLPKEHRTTKVKLWFKAHPFVVAASLFIFMMLGSLTSIYQGTGNQFSLETNDVSQLEKVVVKNNHVIVPEGQVIDGDIVVRNGDIDVQGEVRGNVIVFDGAVTYSSTAEIGGQIEEIDRVLDWFLYELKSIVRDLTGY